MKVPEAKQKRRWMALSCLLFCLALGLGLFQVWLNNRQVELSYRLKTAKNRLEIKKELKAKLEIERDSLTSPYNLRKKSEEFGLKPAEPGQIRKIPSSEESD